VGVKDRVGGDWQGVVGGLLRVVCGGGGRERKEKSKSGKKKKGGEGSGVGGGEQELSQVPRKEQG